ncbi:peptidoglycan-binding protein [Tropicimonas sp. IMCC6043]|uniref:peptidoglycan-binding domain-containing protein n=1 Tax=Tropicimonas sp. IMCC6043 TaxID=2510645 RepID=UPI00101C1CD4|nr:peptidoglycan-binding domain-containing protein [Tropicimonas sp. IMCC6043]RYH10677.1 peptidoglycan-binding protein [Tropicimonas sp. IMCC6043]
MVERTRLYWTGGTLAAVGCLVGFTVLAQQDGTDSGGAFPTFQMTTPNSSDTTPSDTGGAPAFPTFDLAAPESGGAITPQGAGSEASDLIRVGSCYIAQDIPASDPEIVVEVEIDSEGKVASLPELVEPEQPTVEQRLIFVNLVTALESCAPYGAGSAGRHRLAATEDDVRLVSDSTVAVPAPPPQGPIPGAASWLPGTPDTEADLELSRREKAELQARLMVMGHDPNGIDGMPGKGTRAALKAWQEANGIPASGYLDQIQMTILMQQSEPAFAAWLQDPANRETIESAAAAAPVAQKKASGNNRAKLPPGYFWYKGRMCKKVFGSRVLSCR